MLSNFFVGYFEQVSSLLAWTGALPFRVPTPILLVEAVLTPPPPTPPDRHCLQDVKVMVRAKASRNYLYSVRFVLDAAACLPLDVIQIATVRAHAGPGWRTHLSN